MFWNRRDSELESELGQYLEAETQACIERGMTPEEAHFAARRKLGNLGHIKEQTREVWGFAFLERLLQDVIYGWRLMKRSPIFTLVAVLSLAIGIGANTAIFRLVDQILLRDLPIEKPNELVSVERVSSTGASALQSIHFYEFLKDHTTSLSGITAVSMFNWDAETRGSGLMGEFAAGNLFSVLGLKPAAGRLLHPADDNEATDGPVVVLDYEFWRTTFGRDPKVIGTMLKINKEPFLIVGVAPAEFFGLSADYRPKIYVPARLQPRLQKGRDYITKSQKTTMYWLSLAGRLKPGVQAKQAELELSQLLDNFNTGNSVINGDKETVHLISCARGFSDLRGKYSRPLLFLMASTLLVLLIACVNIANLMLERASARRREIAMRFALGASRWRIGRQLLTEGLMISCLGGTLAIFFYYWGSKAMVSWLELKQDNLFDTRLLLFTYMLAMATTIVFSLAPLAGVISVDPRSGIKDHSVGSAGGRLGKGLVIFETALSLVLLVGAMLFFSSLRNLKTVPAGFKSVGALQVQLNPNWGPGSKAIDFDKLQKELAALPNVKAAGMATRGLLRQSTSKIPGFRNRKFVPKKLEDAAFEFASITNGYFEAAGIPLVAGRGFDQNDAKGGDFTVAVINQTMANRFWGRDNPVGDYFSFGPSGDSNRIQVIGVAGDAKYSELRDPFQPMAYFPYHKEWLPMYSAVIRTDHDAVSLSNPVRKVLQSAQKDLFVNAETLEERIDDSLSTETILSILSGVFGCVALLLASMGIFGVIAYAVTRRTAEMGLRMALGAMPGQITWMMLRESMSLALIGVALGIPGAFLLRQSVTSMLYGIEPAINVMLIMVGAVVLLLAAALAGLGPAFRASRVEPLSALRCD